MQQRLNQIEDREDFRPVAPVIMQERLDDWFHAEKPGNGTALFMLFVYDVKPGQASRIPAVTHVDGTARVQTVRRAQNPAYYDVLAAFERRTGVPILVNTSAQHARRADCVHAARCGGVFLDVSRSTPS